MLSSTSRAARPKLSLSISSATSTASAPVRPTLSLRTPTSTIPSPRTPISPSSALTPTTCRNTHANQRGLCTAQNPTFAYALNSNTKSILKRGQNEVPTRSHARARGIQFAENPVVHCITPISWEDGDTEEMYRRPSSRDERRWGRAT